MALMGLADALLINLTSNLVQPSASVAERLRRVSEAVVEPLVATLT